MRALLTVGVAAWLAVALAAQRPAEPKPLDPKQAEYQKRLYRHRVDAAQAYVEIAWWGRKVGLVAQASTLFLRAKEAGHGQHQMADNLAQWMEQYGEGFWQVRPKRPAKFLVNEAARRVRAADKAVRKSHVEVAKLALAAGLLADAQEHCGEALQLGAELMVGKDGVTKLEGLLVPEPLAGWLQERLLTTGTGQRVYDVAAKAADPKLACHEERSAELVVRTDLGAEAARRLHALGMALLPHLEDRLDDAPARALQLWVFTKRSTYDAYLRSLGVPAAAAGLAEYGSFQTIVCAEGKGEPELHALVLHELSHLFFFGAAPATMPDWYAEGFAESFGGQGTFQFDGKALQLGGPMAKERLVALQQAPVPLAELLAGDAEALWQADSAKALRFYTAAWAFQRFLLQPGCPYREDFLRWEARCRGTVVGSGGGAPGRSPLRSFGDRRPAQAWFDAQFGKQLPAMDAAFQKFVRGL
jgi:hypothetical protein